MKEKIVGFIILVLAFGLSFAASESSCPADGEAAHWVADYCMLKMETDDEIAVSACMEEERKPIFPSDCASNLHFKRRMCELMISIGTRAGTANQCVSDPTFKGRTVEAGGVGALPAVPRDAIDSRR